MILYAVQASYIGNQTARTQTVLGVHISFCTSMGHVTQTGLLLERLRSPPGKMDCETRLPLAKLGPYPLKVEA
jgi:hypothetical protein